MRQINKVCWTLLGRTGVSGVGNVMVMKEGALVSLDQLSEDEVLEMFGKPREEVQDMIAQKLLEVELLDVV